MDACYADERSGLSELGTLVQFPLLHARNCWKRIFYNYFLRGFSMASINLVAGFALLIFGVVFGLTKWVGGAESSVLASPGTVMLAGLPVLLGGQLLLNFIAFDMANVPRVPIHRRLQSYQCRRPDHPAAPASSARCARGMIATERSSCECYWSIRPFPRRNDTVRRSAAPAAIRRRWASSTSPPISGSIDHQVEVIDGEARRLSGRTTSLLLHKSSIRNWWASVPRPLPFIAPWRLPAKSSDAGPQLPIVLGGPHASSNVGHAMSFPAFDFAVVGEGEATLEELARTIAAGGELSAVKGIAFRRGGELVVTPPRPPPDGPGQPSLSGLRPDSRPGRLCASAVQLQEAAGGQRHHQPRLPQRLHVLRSFGLRTVLAATQRREHRGGNRPSLSHVRRARNCLC